MKKLQNTFFWTLLALNLSAQVPSYVPLSGLTAWYAFTGNANDLSGNNNNGTVFGATLTTDRFGAANAAYNFNGVNDYISSTPVGLPTGNTARTISAWFTTTTSAISTNQYPNIQTITAYGIGAGGPVIFPQSVYAPSGKATFESGSSQNLISSSNPVNNGVWHNITTTYGGSGTPVSMYIDGILEGSTSSITLATGLSFFGIGNTSWANVAFKGKIDDIGIWNRALTQTEITALFQGCTSNPTVSVTAAGSLTFCAGNPCTLTANSAPGYSYQWFNNGVLIPTATNSLLIPNQAGIYSVRVTDPLTSCFTISQANTIVVNPLPIVSLAFQNYVSPIFVYYRSSPIILIASPSGGLYSGPGITGSSFSPTLSGLGNKIVKYSYTDNNGCSNFSSKSVIVYDTLICQTATGIIKNSNETLNNSSIKIYPNPSQGLFTLELTECKNSMIIITDVLGRIILRKNAQLVNEVDLSNQKSGVYSVSIMIENEITYTAKIIRE